MLTNMLQSYSFITETEPFILSVTKEWEHNNRLPPRRYHRSERLHHIIAKTLCQFSVYFSVSAKNVPVASIALYSECKSVSLNTLKV